MNLYMQTTLLVSKPYDFVEEEEIELVSAEILSAPGIYSDELPTEFCYFHDHYEGYIGAGADKETVLSIQKAMEYGVRELSRKFPALTFQLQHEFTGDKLTASAKLTFKNGE